MPGAVYSYHIVRLRPKIALDVLYSAFAFKSQSFFRQATILADGSGQRYVVSQNNFRKIRVALPPIEKQKRIACTLDAAKREIELLGRLVDLYHTQKRGLMQKLFNYNQG